MCTRRWRRGEFVKRLTVPPGMPDAAHSAWRVALRRAAHQLYDDPVVFHDPYAVPLLGAPGAEALRRTPVARDRGKPRQWSRSLRAFVVARAVFAEECLTEAYGAGTRQYCLLGAGLDTFAWRNPWADLRMWELDLPEVQRWKGELVREAGGGAWSRAGRCERIEGDLVDAPWPPGNMDCRMDLGQPALFAMLGVAPFLPPDTLRLVLERVRRFPPGSAIVFDYRLPREVLPDEERRQFDSLQTRATAKGEPFGLGWRQEEMRAELGGFGRVEDLGAEEINARYFAGRADGLAVRGAAVRLVRVSL